MALFKLLEAYFFHGRLLQTDIQMMSLLDIAKSGLDEEDTPYIRLRSGEIFYSFLPNKRERTLYGMYKRSLPAGLSEDCFRVAMDIIQRYYRENSHQPIPPKTHHLYPGWGFIDVGTYLGYGAIKAAKKISSKGTVVAVEALPESYKLLVKNIVENELDYVYPVHAAVCDQDGTLDFFTNRGQDNSIHQTLKDQILGRSLKYPEAISVPAKTIDTIIETVGYPFETMNTLVSFEINGAEPEALLGAENFLRTCPRFDLRIAARYGPKGSKHCKERLLEILSVYPDITAVDLEPYVYAFKYRPS